MKTIEVSVNELKLAEKNVRLHNEVQIKEFARSLEMFGQLRPVIVDSDYKILCGNGLYLAAKRLNWPKLNVVVMADLTEAQKKKLMIADNRIFELGTSNLSVIDEFLEDLSNDLDIPGYDEEMLQLMVGDIESVNEQIQEYGRLEKEKVDKIVKNQESLERKIDNQPKETVVEKSVNNCEPDLKMQDGNNENCETDSRKYVVCPKCGEKIWVL